MCSDLNLGKFDIPNLSFPFYRLNKELTLLNVVNYVYTCQKNCLHIYYYLPSLWTEGL